MGNEQTFVNAPGDVSEIKANDIYMTVILKLFSTDVNLNNTRVTEAFIDEIANHSEKYSWVPFCVDKRALKDGHTWALNHKMNPSRTRFTTEQIGSFVRFWKEHENGKTILYGETRIPKRDGRVCDMLQRLYENGDLNVSFEIMAKSCREDEGVIVVDADPDNVLIGMTVVSAPAYPDASSAVLMVAEHVGTEADAAEIAVNRDAIEQEGENMDKEKMISETAEKENVQTAEPAVQAEQEPSTEETQEEKPAEEAETSNEEPAVQEEEPVPEKAECKPEKAEDYDCDGDVHEDVCELKARIAEQEQTVASLIPYKEMVEASEKDAERKKLMAFAEKHGLDEEDEEVKAAIEALDYAALMDLTMKDPEEPKRESVQMASFAAMTINNPKAFLFERGTYKDE